MMFVNDAHEVVRRASKNDLTICVLFFVFFFFFSSRRRHTRLQGDWSSDVCSSDLQRARDEPPPVLGSASAASAANASRALSAHSSTTVTTNGEAPAEAGAAQKQHQADRKSVV